MRPEPVRRLVPADAAQYRALMLMAYEQHPDAFTSSRAEREALPVDWWADRLRDDPGAPACVLGCNLAGHLVGCAGVQFESADKARHKSKLFGMYVHPDARGHGIGEQLVLAVKQLAVQRPGLRTMLLTVTQGNQHAEELYKRCGFSSFGVEPMAVAVNNRFVSKVHMWCDLAQ